MQKILKIALLLVVFFTVLQYTTRSVFADMPIIATNSATFALSGVFGKSGGSYTTKEGFKFTTGNQAVYVCQANVTLSTVNGPADNVIVSLYQGGSYTTGTLISTSNAVSAYAINSTLTSVPFYFGSSGALGIGCQQLNANTVYWFIVSRTGSPDTKYYNFYFTTNDTTNYSTPSYTDWGPNMACGGGSAQCYFYGSLQGYGGAVASGSGSLNLNYSMPFIECGAFQDLCNGFTSSVNFLLGLLIPQTIDLTEVNTLQTALNARAPFSYLSTIFAFNYSSPATSAALPSFSIPINSTVSLPNNHLINFNVTVPSAAQGIFTFFRGLTTILIWLAFFAYIVNIARGIFK
jgi:hypothetical protein